MAKADLILQAQELGLEVDETMTVKQIESLISGAEQGDENEEGKANGKMTKAKAEGIVRNYAGINGVKIPELDEAKAFLRKTTKAAE